MQARGPRSGACGPLQTAPRAPPPPPPPPPFVRVPACPRQPAAGCCPPAPTAELKELLYALFGQFGKIIDVVTMRTDRLRGQVRRRRAGSSCSAGVAAAAAVWLAACASLFACCTRQPDCDCHAGGGGLAGTAWRRSLCLQAMLQLDCARNPHALGAAGVDRVCRHCGGHQRAARHAGLPLL